MQTDKPVLALFDFCETLIKFQTGDAFVHFCREKTGSWRMKAIQRLTRVLRSLRVFTVLGILAPKRPWHKQMVLSQLKGIPYEKLNELAKAYLSERLLPSMVPVVKEKLLQHIARHDRIWIVSGGYDAYISKFANHFGIDGILASRIGFDHNGKCTGRLLGMDCMGLNKVRLLENKIGDARSNYHIVGYSDSKSDLPFLNYVDEGYVISHNESQQWAKDNSLKEIIWD